MSDETIEQKFLRGVEAVKNMGNNKPPSIDGLPIALFAENVYEFFKADLFERTKKLTDRQRYLISHNITGSCLLALWMGD